MKRMIALLVLGLSIVAGSAGSASAITEGLILHLEFEGDFYDSSGHALHGIVHGNPTFVDGVDGVDRGYGAGLFGQALSLYGVGHDYRDFVRVADDDLLDVTSLTLMAWVKVTSFTNCWRPWQHFIHKPGAFTFQEDYHTGRVRFGVETEPWSTWGPTVIEGSGLWQHIAGTYDAATGVMNFFVDGMLDFTVTGAPGDIPATATDLFIGHECDYNWYGSVALMDEVRIYNRALTLGEIQAVSKIPEPATMLLLGIGLSGLAFWGKRKRD